jgi:hypothetical protein
MKEPATICFVLLACNFMQYILNSLLILSRWKSLPLRDLHLRQRQNSNREGRRKEMWKWGVTYRETLSSHLLVRWWHKWQIDIKRTQREWNFGREGLLLVPSQEATSHCRQVWGRWARYLADPGPPKTKDFVWQAVRILFLDKLIFLETPVIINHTSSWVGSTDLRRVTFALLLWPCTGNMDG